MLCSCPANCLSSCCFWDHAKQHHLLHSKCPQTSRDRASAREPRCSRSTLFAPFLSVTRNEGRGVYMHLAYKGVIRGTVRTLLQITSEAFRSAAKDCHPLIGVAEVHATCAAALVTCPHCWRRTRSTRRTILVYTGRMMKVASQPAVSTLSIAPTAFPVQAVSHLGSAVMPTCAVLQASQTLGVGSQVQQIPLSYGQPDGRLL